jgi:hypothetical protein
MYMSYDQTHDDAEIDINNVGTDVNVDVDSGVAVDSGNTDESPRADAGTPRAGGTSSRDLSQKSLTVNTALTPGPTAAKSAHSLRINTQESPHALTRTLTRASSQQLQTPRTVPHTPRTPSTPRMPMVPTTPRTPGRIMDLTSCITPLGVRTPGSTRSRQSISYSDYYEYTENVSTVPTTPRTPGYAPPPPPQRTLSMSASIHQMIALSRTSSFRSTTSSPAPPNYLPPPPPVTNRGQTPPQTRAQTPAQAEGRALSRAGTSRSMERTRSAVRLEAQQQQPAAQQQPKKKVSRQPRVFFPDTPKYASRQPSPHYAADDDNDNDNETDNVHGNEQVVTAPRNTFRRDMRVNTARTPMTLDDSASSSGRASNVQPSARSSTRSTHTNQQQPQPQMSTRSARGLQSVRSVQSTRSLPRTNSNRSAMSSMTTTPRSRYGGGGDEDKDIDIDIDYENEDDNYIEGEEEEDDEEYYDENVGETYDNEDQYEDNYENDYNNDEEQGEDEYYDPSLAASSASDSSYQRGLRVNTDANTYINSMSTGSASRPGSVRTNLPSTRSTRSVQSSRSTKSGGPGSSVSRHSSFAFPAGSATSTPRSRAQSPGGILPADNDANLDGAMRINELDVDEQLFDHMMDNNQQGQVSGRLRINTEEEPFADMGTGPLSTRPPLSTRSNRSSRNPAPLSSRSTKSSHSSPEADATPRSRSHTPVGIASTTDEMHDDTSAMVGVFTQNSDVGSDNDAVYDPALAISSASSNSSDGSSSQRELRIDTDNNTMINSMAGSGGPPSSVRSSNRAAVAPLSTRSSLRSSKSSGTSQKNVSYAFSPAEPTPRSRAQSPRVSSDLNNGGTDQQPEPRQGNDSGIPSRLPATTPRSRAPSPRVPGSATAPTPRSRAASPRVATTPARDRHDYGAEEDNIYVEYEYDESNEGGYERDWATSTKSTGSSYRRDLRVNTTGSGSSSAVTPRAPDTSRSSRPLKSTKSGYNVNEYEYDVEYEGEYGRPPSVYGGASPSPRGSAPFTPSSRVPSAAPSPLASTRSNKPNLTVDTHAALVANSTTAMVSVGSSRTPVAVLMPLSTRSQLSVRSAWFADTPRNDDRTTVSVAEDITDFAIRRSFIIWLRYAIARSKHKRQRIQTFSFMYWRDMTVKLRLIRAAFFERLYFFGRYMKLRYHFSALAYYYELAKKSRFIVIVRNRLTAAKVFDQWYRLSLFAQRLRSCEASYVQRMFFKVWRVKTRHMPRIDGLQHKQCAWLQWTNAYKACSLHRKRVLRKITKAWRTFCIFKRELYRFHRRKDLIGFRMAKKLTATYSNLLRTAFEIWKSEDSLRSGGSNECIVVRNSYHAEAFSEIVKMKERFRQLAFREIAVI